MLQSTADLQVDGIQTTRAGVLLTILALFLRIEMLVGSYQGGRAHYVRGDRLMHTHHERLCTWDLGRRIVIAWISVRCWYSAQQFPGSDESLPSHDKIREPVMNVLAKYAQPNDALLPLLCECYIINERVLFSRLIGAGPTYPGFHSWLRTMKTLRPSTSFESIRGFLANGTEESHLVRLRALQHDLDVWHDRLPLYERPILAITSRSRACLRSLPVTPVTFHSQQAAATYMRYAAAQFLCDQDHLDACSGGNLAESCEKPSHWTDLILDILGAFDVEVYIQTCSDSMMCLLWILLSVVATRSLELHVLDVLKRLLPLLQRLAALPGSMMPPWMVSLVLDELIEARSRRQVIMHLTSEHDGSEEWTHIWENPSSFQAAVVGRSIDTGVSFCEIVNV